MHRTASHIAYEAVHLLEGVRFGKIDAFDGFIFDFSAQ